MKNTTTELDKIPSLQDIESALLRFLAAVEKEAINVGQMIARRMEQDPKTIEQLSSKGFDRYQLMRLYEVGLGRKDPRLLLDSSPVAELVWELPVEEQKMILDNGVKVVVVEDDGKAVERPRTLQQLTSKEAKRVFREDGSLRPVEEQIPLAKAEQRKIKVLPAHQDDRFQISDDGDTIAVLAKTEFTLTQWMKIAEDAAAKQREFLGESMTENQVKARRR